MKSNNNNRWILLNNKLIDDAVKLNLNVYSIVIYALSCRFVNKKQEWTVPLRFIYKRLKIGRSTAIKAIKTLINNGMIEKKRKAGINGQNIYMLKDNWLGFDRIRQTKNIKNFFWIDNFIMERRRFIEQLGVIPIAVYIALHRYYNSKTKEAYPALKKRNGEGICKQLNIGKRTAIKAIKKLENFGLISIRKNKKLGTNNIYSFNEIEKNSTLNNEDKKDEDKNEETFDNGDKGFYFSSNKGNFYKDKKVYDLHGE